MPATEDSRRPAPGTLRLLSALFAVSIAHAVVTPLLTAYWLRDNNGPALAPGYDYRPVWMSDADFRGLDAEAGPEYATPGGGKTYAAGETWRRFRPDYVPSPDGRWHVKALARGPLNPYGLRAYLLGAVPSLTFDAAGLLVCYYGLRADRSRRPGRPDPGFTHPA